MTRRLGSVESFDYGLEILVAGLSGFRAHIHHVSDPGVAQCFDAINFHAVGSGAPLALNALIASGCHQGLSMPDALMHVFNAKTISQKAPGVGLSTDLAVILEAGILSIPRESIAALVPIYDLWKDGADLWTSEFSRFVNQLVASQRTESDNVSSLNTGEQLDATDNREQDSHRNDDSEGENETRDDA